VLERSGIRSTRSAAARSYATFGHALDAPILGCLVVLKRRGGHHVGIYEGSHKGKLMLLGGNQGDAVSVDAFDADDVIAYRWPDIYTTHKHTS
jgi:uncharacterized protein (TIGR02594 family)